MPLTDMGTQNAHWGICGFTSSLYALHEHSQSRKKELASGGRTGSRVLAEIKSYLRMLQAEDRSDILDSIETFTRSFKGFESFTVDNYIAHINEVPGLFAGGDEAAVVEALEKDKKFSIAMPPSAVVDYLQRVCDFGKAALVGPNSGKNELILGVKKPGRPGNMHNGLAHYLYALKGTIHSWGNEYTSVKDANASYTVCYEISPLG